MSGAVHFLDVPCELGIAPHPTLAVTNTGAITPGTKLTFKSDAINGTVPEDQLFCQMLLGGQPNSIPLPFNECVVPDVNGPVAVFITADNQPLVSNTVDRQTNNGKLLTGPSLLFVDTKPQVLAQMLRSGSDGSKDSTSTQTITPEQASRVVAGASSTAAGGATPTGAPKSNGVENGGKPNLATGPSQDNKINVLGWEGL